MLSKNKDQTINAESIKVLYNACLDTEGVVFFINKNGEVEKYDFNSEDASKNPIEAALNNKDTLYAQNVGGVNVSTYFNGNSEKRSTITHHAKELLNKNTITDILRYPPDAEKSTKVQKLSIPLTDRNSLMGFYVGEGATLKLNLF